MGDTATPIMDAEYYADIELPETVARNVYKMGQRMERDRARLMECLHFIVDHTDSKFWTDARNLLRELEATMGKDRFCEALLPFFFFIGSLLMLCLLAAVMA